MSFELQRFIVRTAHLVILSSILIWFGIHQRFTSLFVRLDDFDSLIGQGDAGALALRVTMEAAGAGTGILLDAFARRTKSYAGLRIDGGCDQRRSSAPGRWSAIRPSATPFLFDVAKDRALDQDRALVGAVRPGRRPFSILPKRTD